MQAPDILSALKPVIQSFEKLDIPYYIGGSVASSVYGMARATLDVDIIADIKTSQITGLKKNLEGDFYIDADMIADAIGRTSSFNLIHLDTMLKIDVFVHVNHTKKYFIKSIPCTRLLRNKYRQAPMIANPKA